jgi:hypothetical protein
MDRTKPVSKVNCLIADEVELVKESNVRPDLPSKSSIVLFILVASTPGSVLVCPVSKAALSEELSWLPVYGL